MEKKQFNVRGFISLLTACSFILMSVTGIVLYFTPQGRIAFWTNWKFIGLTKTVWISMSFRAFSFSLPGCITSITTGVPFGTMYGIGWDVPCL